MLERSAHFPKDAFNEVEPCAMLGRIKVFEAPGRLTR